LDFFRNYLDIVSNAIKEVDFSLLDETARLLRRVRKAGGKIIIAGNGGSAALASHVSVDLTKNAGVRAISFNEVDLITCFANDYGYEKWVEKAIEFYADPHDMLILISSSGSSRNILNGAVKGRELGLNIVSLSGFSPDNPLRQLGHISFWVDSSDYNIVEMTHSAWLLSIVDKIIDDNAKNNSLDKEGL
jgi:D-sedoheptulose 7-phosphate isomerase